MTDVEKEVEQREQHRHPSAGQYIEIGVILAVVTAIEVALFYAGLPRTVTVPALLVLTVIKFTLVVLWFMHLRFDHLMFSRVFAAGVSLALAVFAAVLAIQLL